MVDDRAPDRRLDARLGAHALAGPRRVAALQRDARGRPRARARGRRRRARDLRRRAAADPGLPHRHLRPALPAAADARDHPARVPAPGDEAHHGLDGRRAGCRRAGRRPRRRRRGHARSTSTTRARAPRGRDSRRERRPADEARARRRHRQRDVRVRRRRARSSTGSRGSGSLARPDGARQGSALAVLFSGREPVAALARGALESPPTPAGTTLALAGLRATVEAPLDRWTVALRRRRRPGLRARVRGARRRRRRSRTTSRPRARRDGGLRPAVPRARHGARRRARAAIDGARPARPRVGRARLGADRARRAP